MKKILVAVQLYSVRNDCARDLPGVLKAVAQMGYDGVEFAGYYNRTAEELRAMLDDVGLKVAGAHVGIQTLLGDELEKSVAFHRVLGNRFLIVPGLPTELRATAADWRRTADLFNEIAARLAPYGMMTGYHNHSHEFKPMEGKIPWEILFDATHPEVCMQPDSGNARDGGADIIPYIRKYPGRSRTVHLKEYSSDRSRAALLGEGEIRWMDLFDACERVGGTEWYIIEQETYSHPPLECIRICRENLRRLGR
jgi:sugar phosphate isomerase/epimerase